MTEEVASLTSACGHTDTAPSGVGCLTTEEAAQFMTLLPESCTRKLLPRLVLHLRAPGPTTSSGDLHKQGPWGAGQLWGST